MENIIKTAELGKCDIFRTQRVIKKIMIKKFPRVLSNNKNIVTIQLFESNNMIIDK